MQKYKQALENSKLAQPHTTQRGSIKQATASHASTHTHTHTELLHADTCKNICPNTKIGPQRLHLHLCPGPHLHTGVRMWHIHTDRERDSREGGGRTRAGWITLLRSTRKLFLDIISVFWSVTMCVIFIFKQTFMLMCLIIKNTQEILHTRQNRKFNSFKYVK